MLVIAKRTSDISKELVCALVASLTERSPFVRDQDGLGSREHDNSDNESVSDSEIEKKGTSEKHYFIFILDTSNFYYR